MSPDKILQLGFTLFSLINSITPLISSILFSYHTEGFSASEMSVIAVVMV